MSRWFRMYNEVLDDPKVQALNGSDFKAWVNLLCLTARNDGVLPPFTDIAFALRMNKRQAQATLGRLIEAGLLDVCGERFRPHKWDERQFKSDTSNERVKRHRSKKCNVTNAVTVTPPDTETESETEYQSREEGFRGEGRSHTHAREARPGLTVIGGGAK